MEIVNVVVEVLLLYLLLDFLTGVVHWWMDRYGREDMPSPFNILNASPKASKA